MKRKHKNRITPNNNGQKKTLLIPCTHVQCNELLGNISNLNEKKVSQKMTNKKKPQNEMTSFHLSTFSH